MIVIMSGCFFVKIIKNIHKIILPLIWWRKSLADSAIDRLADSACFSVANKQIPFKYLKLIVF